MQSGLADFDVSGFDDALLKQGGSVHSPLEFLWPDMKSVGCQGHNQGS